MPHTREDLQRMGIAPWHGGEDPMLLFDQARTACNSVRGDYQNPLMIYDENMQILRQTGAAFIADTAA